MCNIDSYLFVCYIYVFLNLLCSVGAPSAVGTAYTSGVPGLTLIFLLGSCCLIFSFLCNVLCIIVYLFVVLFLPLYRLSFGLQLLITLLVSSNLYIENYNFFLSPILSLVYKYFINSFCFMIQSNLPKLNLIGANFYVQNKQVFTLYRLNLTKISYIVTLFIKLRFNTIPIYSRFSLGKFHCT